MALLELRDVTRRFGDLVAVDDVSLSNEAGEFFTLLSSSGCGRLATPHQLHLQVHCGKRSEIMMRKTYIRRPVAVLAMLLGAALIFLGSETRAGLLVLTLGVLIEVIGIAFTHKG